VFSSLALKFFGGSLPNLVSLSHSLFPESSYFGYSVDQKVGKMILVLSLSDFEYLNESVTLDLMKNLLIDADEYGENKSHEGHFFVTPSEWMNDETERSDEKMTRGEKRKKKKREKSENKRKKRKMNEKRDEKSHEKGKKSDL